ncbi:transglutaminase-like domain-containing protein [Haloferula chungangensis]|uniref:Transglutaminase-like domain-containing protein n=1 Tax=Haloferula chungangensis TaxID=1048331 RepID=A0ABW2L869_9BACT
MRSLVMVLAMAAAYGLLRGYPEAWSAVLRTCLAVLILVAGVGLWGKREGEKGELVESRRRASWMDYLAIGAAVLSIECLFLVFFSTLPEPLESAAARVEEWLRPEMAAARKVETEGERNTSQGNWLWNDEQRRPLPKRTNFKQGNRPEIFLQPSGEIDAARMLDSRLYVQAFSLSRYDEAAWMALSSEARTLRSEDDGWLRLPGERSGAAISCRVYQGSEKNGQNPLTGLQGLTAARVESVASLDARLQLLPKQEEGFEYDTISKPRTIDDLAGEDVKLPMQIPASLLELPGGSLGSRIFLQAEVVAGDGEVMDRLTRIRNHLRTTLEYSLVTENPNNRDPLENFMFYEQKGHCELYATAGALLARAVGIPARISYGWVGGTYYEGSRLFVFRAREAHAWAEVWLKGYGWVVLDPTPPTALERPNPERAAEGEKPPGSEDLGVETEDELAAERPVWKYGLGLAALFGIPGLVMLSWRSLKREDSGTWGAKVDMKSRRVAYLETFVSKCRERGIRIPPGRTLRGLVQGLDEAPDFANELIQYHYAVRYEGRTRDPAKEAELKKKVEQWL